MIKSMQNILASLVDVPILVLCAVIALVCLVVYAVVAAYRLTTTDDLYFEVEACTTCCK